MGRLVGRQALRMLLEPFDAEQFAANGLFILRQSRSGAPEGAPQKRFQRVVAFPALTPAAVSMVRRASVKRPAWGRYGRLTLPRFAGMDESRKPAETWPNWLTSIRRSHGQQHAADPGLRGRLCHNVGHHQF